MKKGLLALGPAVFLAGCVTIPPDLQGPYQNGVPSSPTVTAIPVASANGAPVNVPVAVTADNAQTQVRWGGELINTRPTREGSTCFEILSRPLDSGARPRDISLRGSSDMDASMGTTGRFVACITGFYDPELYKAGRDVTVVGTQTGTIGQTVGGMVIQEPLVNATNIHLWRPRPPAYYNPYPYGPYGFGDPLWGGAYGPGWGYGGGWGGGYGRGFYGGGRTVIIRQSGGSGGHPHH